MNSAFYAGAIAKPRRDPYLPGDDAVNEPDLLSGVPSADVNSPARSRSGGATAVSPGAGASPTGAYSPDPSSFGVSGSGNPAPNIIRDVYSPELQDVSQKLQSAYEAPRPGMFRQVAGALLSRKNPAIGGLVSGETQRARTIEPLQQQYGLVSSQIMAQRAANTADLQNANIGSEIQGRKDLATYHQGVLDVRNNPPAPQAKTPQEQAMTSLQGKINPATKQPYTPDEAYQQTLQYGQDVKPTPETKGIIHDIDEGNGVNHSLLIDPSTGRTIKDLGRSKASKPTDTTSKDIKPVVAYDKAGKAHIVPKSEAMDPANGYSNVMEASDKDVADAKTHAVVLNDMQSKLNDVDSNADALDQNGIQRGIISQALSHSEPGMINDAIRATALSQASPKTKAYIQSVLSLKESALGLPKEITGGSRTSEIQGNALFQTLPSGASVNSDYAHSQVDRFQQNIDRLRDRVPQVRGMEELAPTRKAGTKASPSGSAGGPPASMLKEGVHTTFKNGQTWTLQNGQPTQVNEAQ